MVLVEMDELPTAVINIAKGAEGQVAAQALLQTLRRLRLGTKRIRWIICGSIGVHHALRIAGATVGVVNDLANIPFGPLVGEEARTLATKLLIGINALYDSETVDELVVQTDGIPFFMHKIMSQLELDRLNKVVTVADVRETTERFINDRDEGQAATHLLSRINDYYGELGPAAHKVLDETSLSPAGAVIDKSVAGDRTNELIDLLVDDHYLIDGVGTAMCWRYPLLRRIWVSRRRLK